jgi:hypothetical protein
MAIPISAMNKNNVLENKSISISADVPTWKVGDSWTYNTRIYQAAQENSSVDMIGIFTGELIFEVVDDSGDIYTLEGLIKPLHGIIDMPGNIDFKLTRISSQKAILEIQKSNLSIIKHEFTRKGITLIKFGPITLPIPIQMQMYHKTEFLPMWEILPFPLFDGKTGDYEYCSLIEEVNLSMFWGLIPLESYKGDGGWVGNGMYNCNKDTITVEAGTFEVYNVSCIVDFGTEGLDLYFSNYAEDVGNIAQGLYHLDMYNGNTSFRIDLELKSTTYEP